MIQSGVSRLLLVPAAAAGAARGVDLHDAVVVSPASAAKPVQMANGKYEAHSWLAKPVPIRPLEFDVDKAAITGGERELTRGTRARAGTAGGSKSQRAG